MGSSSAQNSWDEIYGTGNKYLAEPPIEFVHTIVRQVKEYNLSDNRGLYIGCGNGRNYIPLVNKGLDILGLDISHIALNQLAEKRPDVSNTLVHSDFLGFNPNYVFSYIISIQVFQHGDWQQVQQLFKKVYNLLDSGGLFFLRVRSVNMVINHTYQIVEHTPYGGFTVRFEKGSKKDLDIHYFSIEELNFLTSNNFVAIESPKEVISTFHNKKLFHIEGIWKKR